MRVLRTFRATPAAARVAHGDLDVRAGRFPVHLERVRSGLYRETDSAHCDVCGSARRAEVERLKSRLAELTGRAA